MNSASESFPQLKTVRCLLRKIERADQPKIFEGLSDPEVTRYYGVSYDSLRSSDAQMDFYDQLLETQSGIWWAACLQSDGAFIGACGFNEHSHLHRRAELGFWLLRPYQRQGYMGEIVPRVLRYGFEQMNLHRVEAIVEPGNAASRSLLQQLGFSQEGRHKECEWKNGRFIDLEYFALLENEYRDNRAG